MENTATSHSGTEMEMSDLYPLTPLTTTTVTSTTEAALAALQTRVATYSSCLSS